jgi:ribose-phosphate pyrophosphokinase
MKNALLLAFAEDRQPASALASRLGLPFGEIALHRFPDGEFCPRLPDAAAEMLIYRSFNQPNEKLVALLLVHDALMRDPRVKRSTLIAPYLPYLRQDIAFHPGEPNSQAVLCTLLAARFARIVTVDPHLHRTPDLGAAYPGTTWQVLCAQDRLAEAIQAEGIPPGLVILGPDVESTPLVNRLATRLGCQAATFAKARSGDRQVQLTPPKGLDVRGRPVLILDDMCSTGGTMARLAVALKAAGAQSIEAMVTHALFDAAAAAMMREAGIGRIRSTDSIDHPTNAIPLATLLAEAILTDPEEGCA